MQLNGRALESRYDPATRILTAEFSGDRKTVQQLILE
jgi:hypothetical protein